MSGLPNELRRFIPSIDKLLGTENLNPFITLATPLTNAVVATPREGITPISGRAVFHKQGTGHLILPYRNLFDNVGPLVDSTVEDKPLTIAMHEIHEDKLRLRPVE